MNEYTPIDINDSYTGLPVFKPDNPKKSDVTVYFYNDTVPKIYDNRIQTLDALVDTIDGRTAVFGDMLNPSNPLASMGLVPPQNVAKRDPKSPLNIVIPNSLDDDMTTKFFIGSLTVVGLYIFYRMIIKQGNLRFPLRPLP